MRVKPIVLISSIILISLLVLSGCGNIDNDKQVASVNGEKITAQEFKFFLRSVKNQMESEAKPEEVAKLWDTEEAVGLAKEKALEAVVLDKVQLKKAKDLGLNLDDAEKNEIVQQKKAYMDSVGGRDNYKKELEKLGLNDSSFTTLLENYRLTDKLYRKMISEDARYNISEQTMKEYYDKNLEEQFKAPTLQVRAKHILLNTVDSQTRQPLPQEKQDEAKKTIEEIYARIKAGEDFDVLMQQYSQDPGLAAYPEGYTFGKDGQMVPEFESTAFNLEKGEVSQIIKTDFGYHILKVEDKFEYYPYEQVKEYIRQMITNEAYTEQVEEWKKQVDVQTDTEALKKIAIKTE